MTQDQIDSLVRTLLKMISAIFVAHGMQQMGTAITAPDTIEFACGLVAALVSMYASHTAHSDPPQAEPPGPSSVTIPIPPAQNTPDSTPPSK